MKSTISKILLVSLLTFGLQASLTSSEVAVIEKKLHFLTASFDRELHKGFIVFGDNADEVKLHNVSWPLVQLATQKRLYVLFNAEHKAVLCSDYPEIQAVLDKHKDAITMHSVCGPA